VGSTLDPAAFLSLARTLSLRPSSSSADLVGLRRATSTAYYAVFHQILRHGCLQLVAGASEGDIANVSRWFTHSGVFKAATWVMLAVGGRPPRLADRAAVQLLRGRREAAVGIPDELASLAQTFAQLQSARHQADYSNAYEPVRFTTQQDVEAAGLAVASARLLWEGRDSEDAERRAASEAHGRFLLLCLTASGGPRSR